MRIFTCLSSVVIIVVLASSGARADSLIFESSIEYSGATPPSGPVPWLTATFDDGGTAGTVQFTIEGTNLIGSEYVKECLFNLDPALDPTALVFSDMVKTGSFEDPKIALGANAFFAAADGFYDIHVKFSLRDGPSDKFGWADPAEMVEAVEYTISGLPELTADSFDFLSYEDGGLGAYPTAAHVGGIDPGGDYSGWITVPEPATFALLVLGLVALKRRR